LKKEEAISDILRQLERTKISEGSFRIRFKDSLANKTLEAKIGIDKLIKQVNRESKKIENSLRLFVDWVKNNKRQIITCSLVAGLLIISIVAISAAAIPLIGAKLFIMASIAIICTIYEIFGTCRTIYEVKKALSRKAGLTLREI
jgi:hypothetical protein